MLFIFAKKKSKKFYLKSVTREGGNRTGGEGDWSL